jgi:hypothetical protein
MCQSLYARTSAFDSSTSSLRKVRAVNVGNDGKFIDASTPPASMSITRSWTS